MPTTRTAVAVAVVLWLVGCERTPPKGLPATAPVARPALQARIAVVPAALREGPSRSAPPLRTLAAGDKVEVWREARDPEHVLRVNGGGFVDGRDVLPSPLVPQSRFVIDPGATRFADALRQRPVGKLKLGAQVQVVQSDAWPQVATLVKDGAPAGFVTRDNLGTSAPTAAGLMERALQRARQLDGPGTARLLEGVLTLEPRHQVAAALLSAMLASTDWKRSRALLKLAPPPGPKVEVQFGTPPTGKQAWVVASVLRIREKPNEKARALRDVPIGTELELEGEPAGGWTRARVRYDRTLAALAQLSGPALALGEGRVVPTDAASGYATGYVPMALLSGEPPAGAAVESQLEAARAAGKLEEAVIWAQRANVLLPSPDRARALVNLALDAKRYDVAGRALGDPLRLTRPGLQDEVGLTFYWGCKADPRGATLARVEENAKPDSDCVDFEDTRPCDACLSYEDHGGGEEPDPEAAREADEAKQAEAASRQQAYDARVAQLRTQFPKGPWVRVSVHRKLLDETRRAFLAVTQFDPSQVAPGADLLLRVLEVPFSSGGDASLVDTYVAVDDNRTHRFEVFFAADLESARALAQPADPQRGPNARSPAATLTRPADGCDCGC